MRVLLDDQPFDAEPATIPAAIAAAAAAVEPTGRVLVEVIVDGTAWSETQIAACEDGPMTAAELRLVSADLSVLVRQTLDNAGEALVEVDALQREAAELIQSDRIPQAMERLGEALGTWIAIQEAVVKCSSASAIDLDRLQHDGGPILASIETLRTHLEEMRAALEANDPVGLSDTLMYDLPDVVTEWRSVLQTLSARVSGADSRAAPGA